MLGNYFDGMALLFNALGNAFFDGLLTASTQGVGLQSLG